MQNYYKIDVLLATRNGAKYIEPFIESLAMQKNVEINLFVSDDKSDDGTIAIIKNYSQQFNHITFFNGPNQGPAANFLSMLKYSNSDFIAFADQDDIWNDDHLFNSITRIVELEAIPALSFTKVIEFDTFGNENIWPIHIMQKNNWIFENQARGCTIVFNRKLCEVLKKVDFADIVMHDWIALLIGRYCGKVKFSKYPEIRYRIHSNNTVGVAKPQLTRIFLYLRHFKYAENRMISQAKYFFTKFDEHLNDDGKEIKEILNLWETEPNLIGKYRQIRKLRRIRVSHLENIALKFRLIFS